MFTRDHATIAGAIRMTGRPQCNGGNALPERERAHAERIVNAIADELARAHPSFERNRFETACGFPFTMKERG